MNWRHLGNGFYLARTQAGFRQAAKSYLGQDWHEPDAMLREMVGHPTSYPAICVFGVAYHGYHYLTATCMHVNALRSEVVEE